MAPNKFPSYSARFATALQKIRKNHKVPRPLQTPLFRAGTATALSCIKGYLFVPLLNFYNLRLSR